MPCMRLVGIDARPMGLCASGYVGVCMSLIWHGLYLYHNILYDTHIISLSTSSLSQEYVNDARS